MLPSLPPTHVTSVVTGVGTVGPPVLPTSMFSFKVQPFESVMVIG